MDLDLSNIQGNIVPGFQKDHQAFVLVRFGEDRELARQWLQALSSEIASAEEVLAFKKLFKAIVDRRKSAGWLQQGSQDEAENRDYGALRVVSATWVNVAFTWAGLNVLCGSELQQLSRNLFRSQVAGIQPSDMASAGHALLVLGADWDDDLERERNRQVARLELYGLKPIKEFKGDTLRNGREAFGYKDGISQPKLAGLDSGSGPEVARGEFILGYPSESGPASLRNMPTWSTDGSFLVFLEMQQDVAALEQARRTNVDVAKMTDPAQVGAAFVGRWPSGSPAGYSLDDIRRTAIDPGWNGDAPAVGGFPRFSHVGRSNPSQDDQNARRHRLIRRGIPYRIASDTPEDERRGLIFLAYQADIADQFEYVWQERLNDADFPDPSAGTDPLVGQAPQGGSPRRLTLRDGTDKGEVIEVTVSQFVSLQYGSYLFAPSLSALTELAGGTMTLTHSDLDEIKGFITSTLAELLAKSNSAGGHAAYVRPNAAKPHTVGGSTTSSSVDQSAALDRATQPSSFISSASLGATITAQNPYTSADITLSNFIEFAGPAANNTPDQAYVMEGLQPGQIDPREYWHFNGMRMPITKAIRIPYSYIGDDQAQHNADLLIGFNGPPVP